jgi:hypothetical protein
VVHNGSASVEKEDRPGCVVETVPEDPSHPDGATDIYLIFDGRRIAKRGKPGTLHAMTWIPLEPGVVVRDVPMPESESGWGMVIEINSVRVH